MQNIKGAIESFVERNKCFAAAISCVLFVGAAFIAGWQNAAIVGFLALVVLLAFDHVKRFVVELRLKKAGPFEFDPLAEANKQAVRITAEVVQSPEFKDKLSPDMVDKAVKRAVDNVVTGKVYEDSVQKILDELGVSYERNVPFLFRKNVVDFDFVVPSRGGEKIVIESKYSSVGKLNDSVIDNFLKQASHVKAYAFGARLLVVTNAKLSDEQMAKLSDAGVPVDVLDGLQHPVEIYSRLRMYFRQNKPESLYTS